MEDAANSSGALWSYATVLGPIILAVIIGYALLSRRRLSPAEREAQRRGTERAYDDKGTPPTP